MRHARGRTAMETQSAVSESEPSSVHATHTMDVTDIPGISTVGQTLAARTKDTCAEADCVIPNAQQHPKFFAPLPMPSGE